MGRGCRQGPRLPPRCLRVPCAWKHLEQLQEKQNPSFRWFPTWLLKCSSGLKVDAMLNRNRGQGWGGWGGCRRASQFPGAADTQGQLGGRHHVDAGSCVGERKGTFALAARSWTAAWGDAPMGGRVWSQNPRGAPAFSGSRRPPRDWLTLITGTERVCGLLCAVKAQWY